MVKFERYTSFDDLKAAGATNVGTAAESWGEYRKLIEELQRAVADKKANMTNRLKGKSKNG